MSDYDDFDDFDFKPVTKGLGFHHNEKKDPKKYVKRVDRTKVLSSSTELKKESQMYDQHINKADLSAFYSLNNNSAQEDREIELVSVQKNHSTPLTYVKRVCAWFVDVVIVSLLVTLTFVASALLTGIHHNDILHLVAPSELVAYVSIVFITYYVIYFSILDMYKTPGKNLLKLKMSTSESKISFKRSVVRSFLSLLVLPMIVDAHSIISKTSVIDSRK